ncbi:MAG: hypothetical protein JJE50_04930 [Actinomycetales bacterium]|nr:hypothetical protein [Actinomycetales bacterium]
MGTYKSWNSLKAEVAKARVLEVELQDLKDLHGVKRLGANVLAEIADRLDEEHLVYFPAERLLNNPAPRQTELVRLTLADGPLRKVIVAVQSTDEPIETLLALLDSNNGWTQVEAMKEREANVRAALEDALGALDADLE